MYRDKYGLIVQRAGDGGDTAQRVGLYYLAKYLTSYRQTKHRAEFVWLMCKLEVRPGILVRHPYQEGFRKHPNEFSRDQQDVCVISCGFYFKPLLRRILFRQVMRLGQYQNHDFPQLQTPGIFIRALRFYPLWPVLWFTDLGLLLTSVIAVIRLRDKPGEVDDSNHIARLLQAWYEMSTPVSWLARVIYAKYRPKNYGCAGVISEARPESKNYNETNPVMGALVWYFRKESGGNPEIAEAFRKLILNYF